MIKGLFVLLGLIAVVVLGQSDPSYDHQTTTYLAKFQPTNLQGAPLSVTSYFSPDHSIDVETQLIEDAQATIDIGIPSFASWSGCTNFTGPVGCGVQYVRDNEAFPIFKALLNAIHRGVAVRILTNDYNTQDAPGLIDPLSFLTLAGAETRYYTTTTFIHAKYIATDKKKASVSSVNFSYTSFMKNREAGVILSGSGAQPLLQLMTQVFEFDWAQGQPWPVASYNASDMAIINDQSQVQVTIPPPVNFYGSYVTSVQTVDTTFTNATVIASPDFAWSTIIDSLNAAQSSVDIFIYQITGPDFCNAVQNLAQNNINLKILVSNHIYSKPDYEAATQCYTQLYNAGITIMKTAYDMYTFSHQKFWIIDDSVVFMSTGNWSPTDYPTGSSTFPPYGNSGWRDTNRDFTVMFQNPDVVGNFKVVLDEDYERGHEFHPDTSPLVLDTTSPLFL